MGVGVKNGITKEEAKMEVEGRDLLAEGRKASETEQARKRVGCVKERK